MKRAFSNSISDYGLINKLFISPYTSHKQRTIVYQKIAYCCHRHTLHTVTVARRPSGTFATIMPMRKMTASSQWYPSIKAMMKKLTPRKTATPVMRWMKWPISLAMGVSPTSRPDARFAMRPITVRSPVKTTMPVAVPALNQIPSWDN